MSHSHRTAEERAQIRTLQPALSNNILVAKPLSSADPPRIILPTAARPAQLTKTHTAGHFSSHANLATLERAFWWPGMRKEVDDVAKRCAVCQETRTHQRAADMGAPRLAGAAMDEALVDTQVGVDGYDLLTVLDVATRFLWLIPFKQRSNDNTPKSLRYARAFAEATENFGRFITVTADQGTEFRGAFARALEASGTRVRTNAAYNPDARGAVERLHRTLLAIIAKLKNEQPELSATKRFAAAALAYNRAPRADCKVSPHEAMFGRPPPLTSDAMLLLEPQQLIEAQRAWNAAAHAPQNTAAAINKMQAAVSTANRYRAALQERKRKAPPKLEVGDLVLTRRVPGQSKFENRTRLNGPFTIAHVSPSGMRVDLAFDGGIVQSDVAARNCVPYQRPGEARAFKNAGAQNEWILSPSEPIQDHWLNDEILSYDMRHYFADRRNREARAGGARDKS